MRIIYSAHFTSLDIGDTTTEKRIRSFGALSSGWHYGEGKPFSPEQINRALGKYRRFAGLGLTTTDVIPGLSEEIKLIAYHDGHKVEYIMEADKKGSLIWKKGREVLKKCQHITENDADLLLNEVARAIWNMSGSSTQSITISGGREDLTVWHSTAAIVVVPQLSSASVWTKIEGLGAEFSENTLPEKPENHQSSGNLQIHRSHPPIQ